MSFWIPSLDIPKQPLALKEGAGSFRDCFLLMTEVRFVHWPAFEARGDIDGHQDSKRVFL